MQAAVFLVMFVYADEEKIARVNFFSSFFFSSQRPGWRQALFCCAQIKKKARGCACFAAHNFQSFFSSFFSSFFFFAAAWLEADAVLLR